MRKLLRRIHLVFKYASVTDELLEFVQKNPKVGSDALRLVKAVGPVAEELSRLVEEAVAAMDDGKLTRAERSRLLKRFWDVVAAIRANQPSWSTK